MSHALYSELLDTSSVDRKTVGDVFKMNRIPYSRSVEEEKDGHRVVRDPTEADILDRKKQCKDLMRKLFGEDKSVPLREGAERLRKIEEELRGTKGYIWAILGKVKAAFTIAATIEVNRKIKEVYNQQFDFSEIQKLGKPRPYADRLYKDWNPDHEAAGTYYQRSLLALQIARDLEIELVLP